MSNEENSKNQLLHAVINQMESDFDNNDFESLDTFITELMKDSKNHIILINYLSDDTKEQWLEGKTNTRF